MIVRLPAVFGDGLVSGGVGTLIGPVPAGERWYVTRLDCSNGASVDVDIAIYLRTSGATNRRWKSARLDASGGHCEAIDSKAVELAEGGMILASASVGNQVTFYAAGIRETTTDA
jgi:hypothetical protein